MSRKIITDLKLQLQFEKDCRDAAQKVLLYAKQALVLALRDVENIIDCGNCNKGLDCECCDRNKFSDIDKAYEYYMELAKEQCDA